MTPPTPTRKISKKDPSSSTNPLTATSVVSIDSLSVVSANNPSPAHEPSALLDVRGAAKFLGLSYWRFYGLIQSDELPVIDIGGKFYFRRATLLRWIERAEKKHRAA
jgi:excisionase family DNA binding protein